MSRFYYRRKNQWQYKKPPLLGNNIYLYVQNLFFNFSPSTFEKYADYYKSKYGNSALNYLRNTYALWKFGERRMSGQSCERILKCAPKFFSMEEKFHMLSLYIPSIHAKIIGSDKKQIGQNDLLEYYRSIAKKILETDFNLDWFVEEVFTLEEIKEFKEVVKFTIMNSLVLSFNNTKHDLQEMAGCLNGTDAAIQASYHITFLNCNFHIENPQTIELPASKWNKNVPALTTKYSNEFRKLLIEETVTCLQQIKKGELSQQIAINDLNSLKQHLVNIPEKNEFKSYASFQGKGGILEVNIHRANVTGYNIAIFKSLIIAIIVTAGIIGLGFLMADNLSTYITLMLIFGILTLSYVWSSFVENIKEANEYGRKRQRFAKD